MKIYYIANIRLPTEKAHGIQIMKMCEAFADLGHEVELVVPKRKTHIVEDPFEYYRVRKIFSIKRLWCIDSVYLGRVGFLLESISFSQSVMFYAQFRNGFYYTRDELPALFLKLMRRKVAWEIHMGQQNIFSKLLIKLGVPMVVITQGLKDMYVKLGIVNERIHVSPDGVDIDQFNIKEERMGAREKLLLNENAPIILYTGHLYSWKGADTLAQAASLIKNYCKILFVGGTENDIESFKHKYGYVGNMAILGKKPHHHIPLYLKAANLLIIPNSAKEDISRLYTSPMKLFEYMASKIPIVASDLPSIREVLADSEAYFFTPDSPESLAQAIDEALTNFEEASRRAERAFEKVLHYSWQKRAEKIIEFIS